MSDETGKWLPYNEDGSQHDCKNSQQKEKKQEYTLAEVAKKLESHGIILNVERLMKER
jgi:hypothetical protein